VPELSVVIAAVDAERTARQCLSALVRQLTPEVETIVVSSTACPSLASVFSFATWIVARDSSLVPELWGKGFGCARGRIVAFTTTACTPAAGWVQAWIDAHRSACAAVGGPIETARDASLIDRAVYLARYSAYMPPLTSGVVDDVPGDNGSYKREVLAGYRDEIVNDGFWEADINRRLRRRGETFLMNSNALVVHTGEFSFVSFTRQRWSHGRRFAAAQRTAMPTARRWMRVLAAPLVPVVMLTRIARRTLRRPDRLWLLTSAPWLLWFLAAWSAGECAGYTAGAPPRSRGQATAPCVL